jgi:hypothetical protein
MACYLALPLLYSEAGCNEPSARNGERNGAFEISYLSILDFYC